MAMIHVLGSSIIFCFFLQLLPTADSVSESEALLQLKQSFVNSSSLDSWKAGTQPCAVGSQWLGIICVNGLVSSLRLKNLGLSGKIDINALASLSKLRSVGFVANSFTGPIPEFNRMVLLKGLYLSKNQFSGEIPLDYFKPMEGLKKVWLSGNNFSGQAPPSLFQLSHLMELRLDNNKFSGHIPPPQLPALVSLDMSNNKFQGDIPSTLSRFGPKAFQGNPGLCGVNGCTSASMESPRPQTNKISRKMMFIWVLAAAGVVFLVMLVGIFALKWRQERDDGIGACTSFHISSVRRTDGVTSRGSGVIPCSRAEPPSGRSRKESRRFAKGVEIVMINDELGEFTMSDLMKAAADVLSNGSLMSSYKAMMLSGLTVVVKRIKESAKIGKEQFDAEMRVLGSLRHDNVLTPLAYHYRRDEKLLVYEYIAQGSLLYMLHGDQGHSPVELNWPTRLKIIQGIARGLAYLHNELFTLDLPHGNLKSSNVLLGEENEPLLTEYGLCTVISGSAAAQALAAYRAPEAVLDHNISPKCDVYCMGIIILEVITGKFPAQFATNGEGGVDSVQWVRSALAAGEESDIFDPELKDEMKKLLHIAAACTESNPVQRLDMGEALRQIKDLMVEGRAHDTTTIQVKAVK